MLFDSKKYSAKIHRRSPEENRKEVETLVQCKEYLGAMLKSAGLELDSCQEYRELERAIHELETELGLVAGGGNGRNSR